LTFPTAKRKAALPILGSFGEIIMDKETSSRVSSIAGTILAQLRKNPDHNSVSLSREDAEALAGSALSQDQTPGQSGIHPKPEEFSEAQVTLDPVLHFFHYSHLPPALQATSRAFFLLAAHVINTVPRNAERTVALRKLLEAKDAAVRANLPAREIKQRTVASGDNEGAPIGEPREIGGADEDRDGPVPFDV
jgi:hypothetical protein